MTREEIRGIVVHELGLDQEADDGELAYGAVPEWSSSSHMNVVIAIEEAVGIEFSADEIAELTDIDRIADALAAHARG